MNQQTLDPSSFSLDFLFFIRLIFYLWILAKLAEIVIFRRKKLNVKQRIQRKYVFSHGEMIKNYSSQEVQLMVLTLSNTLKNATQPTLIEKKVDSQININEKKKVNFSTGSNLYYDPPNFADENMMKWETIETKLSQILQNKEKEEKVNQVLKQEIVNEDPGFHNFEEEKVEEEDTLIEKAIENNELI